jgi:hypothetical protein
MVNVTIHESSRTWKIPPPSGDPHRTSLRALAARPERFEHHLMVVARIGDVQLELATASEPLYFAHANVSDEYALPLPTGDAELDVMPFRVFLSDVDDGEDVARIVHRAGDLVLHPYGYLHWPGRLRPPFDPPLMPARRAVLSLVMCACRPTSPVERPLIVSRKDDAKISRGAPPLACVELASVEGVVARVGHATLAMVDRAEPARGGYAVIVEDAELVYLAPGERLDQRALLFSCDSIDADPPPPSWRRAPEPPFEPLPHGAASLPWSKEGIDVRAIDDRSCAITIGATAIVPRYWLARMLFRVALHGFALGYVETYGGFYYDDRDGWAFGVRGGSRAAIDRDDVESLYRAVAPPGYRERL